MALINNCIHVELKGKRKLVVSKFKYGLRGDLYEQATPDGYNYKKSSSAKFLYEHGDAELCNVRKHFGFNGSKE